MGALQAGLTNGLNGPLGACLSEASPKAGPSSLRSFVIREEVTTIL